MSSINDPYRRIDRKDVYLVGEVCVEYGSEEGTEEEAKSIVVAMDGSLLGEKEGGGEH